MTVLNFLNRPLLENWPTDYYSWAEIHCTTVLRISSKLDKRTLGKKIQMGFRSRGHPTWQRGHPTDREDMPRAARYVTFVIFHIYLFVLFHTSLGSDEPYCHNALTNNSTMTKISDLVFGRFRIVERLSLWGITQRPKVRPSGPARPASNYIASLTDKVWMWVCTQ